MNAGDFVPPALPTHAPFTPTTPQSEAAEFTLTLTQALLDRHCQINALGMAYAGLIRLPECVARPSNTQISKPPEH